jgi:hypothetical protein
MESEIASLSSIGQIMGRELHLLLLVKIILIRTIIYALMQAEIEYSLLPISQSLWLR